MNFTSAKELLKQFDIDEQTGALTSKENGDRYRYFVDSDTNEICLVPEERFLKNLSNMTRKIVTSIEETQTLSSPQSLS